ncbi:MAG: hypothetical protein ACYS22_17445 [Planctomycetota bacterium]
MKKVLLLLVAVGLVVGAYVLLPPILFGKKLTFKNGELYYKKPVTEADARVLGETLASTGYFDENARVQLLKEGEVFQARFEIDEEKKDSPEVARTFTALSVFLGSSAFKDKNFEIHLTDQSLETLKTIPGRSATPAAAPVKLPEGLPSLPTGS